MSKPWTGYDRMAAHLEPAATRLAQVVGAGHGVVVDVGSGSGNGLRAARAMGLHAIGLDLSPEQLAAAASAGAPQVRGDAATLPFRSDGVDGVTSNFGVVFSPRVGDALHEIARVLHPEARFAFTSWRPGGWPQAGLDCFARHLGITAPRFPVELGDPDRGGAHLEAAGLAVVAVEYGTLTWSSADLDVALETITTAAGGLRSLRQRLEAAGSWAAAAIDFRAELEVRSRSTSAGVEIDDPFVLYQAVRR